ncbi:1-acyl-sn-glycerol-3-phosphate acyltransferase [bacterium endosymbiont of Pedicinus badii]|uniref:1-acyl-sn-glycerol-3-phosphate acyltransferase n=1 Tax=bacterium endosymbiont of Pedicinus badii TaxID=1719126 RepID=UPI0009B96C19|nr:1-acyl-sn-glycerol-3-phosphate acyltransferase [bacterium endosymbiont of Pedicinus badii]OQM34134.1 hypothetical protein AOQ89_02210 [bacterium endosymbiont of Pedicinus badii]
MEKVLFKKIKYFNSEKSKKIEKKYIIYVFSQYSFFDLILLRIICKKKKFPNPFEKIKINKFFYTRYLSLKEEKKKFSKNAFYNFFNNFFTKKNIKVIKNTIFLPVYIEKEEKNILNSKIKNIFLFIKKIFFFFILQKKNIVQFGNFFLVKKFFYKNKKDKKNIFKKIKKSFKTHFFRQKIFFSKKNFLQKNLFIKKILNIYFLQISQNKKKQEIKKYYYKKKSNIENIIKEISANFSFFAIKICNFFITPILKNLFSKLKIKNIESIQNCAKKNENIIYLPCHRSHIDYFLLSYVLYQNGLTPPYIAAGSNLNFFPISYFLRKLGAFYIRRTFQGNKLYSLVLREYFHELFKTKHPVEYFIEGGRSRTGKLLYPKIGILIMTIQSIMKKKRTIYLVPVHFGYEKILEIKSYLQESLGQRKKKENVLQIFLGLFLLKKLGIACINFGNPINLLKEIKYKDRNFFKNYSFKKKKDHKLFKIAQKISIEIMKKINSCFVINPINLGSSILFSSKKYSMEKKNFLFLITFYISYLKNLPYSSNFIIFEKNPKKIFLYAVSSKNFTYFRKKEKKLIFFSKKQALENRYYKNNIQHVFILQTLVSKIILSNEKNNFLEIFNKVYCLYSILELDFFLFFKRKMLFSFVKKNIKILQKKKLIFTKKLQIRKNKKNMNILEYLSKNGSESFCQYLIIVFLIFSNPKISYTCLKKQSKKIAKSISSEYEMSSKFFDKHFFFVVKKIFFEKEQKTSIKKYYKKVKKIYRILRKIVDNEVLQKIEK